MKCPWCEIEYEMSWTQYARAPFGKHRCPKCHERFRVRSGFRYYCVRTAAVCLGGVPLAFVSALFWHSPLLGWICGCLLTGIPIDKYLDNRTATEKIAEPITGANTGMNKFPVVRQTAWQSVVLQMILIVVFMGVARYMGGASRPALLIGALAYSLYFVVVKYLLERPINQGLKLVHTGKFQHAIPYFENAYEFYARHPWIDRLRFLLLISSTMTFREMALINIAVCYSQIGEGKKSKQYYQRTLTEFPKSIMAQAALKAIQTFESNPR